MEAHANLILAKQEKEAQNAISYYHEMNVSIEKGLCALERHVYSDKVIHSELLLMSALVELNTIHSTPLSNSAPPPPLLKALQIISSVKLDHKLAFLCYCKLAEFFATQSKLHLPEQEKEKKKPKTGGILFNRLQDHPGRQADYLLSSCLLLAPLKMSGLSDPKERRAWSLIMAGVLLRALHLVYGLLRI